MRNPFRRNQTRGALVIMEDGRMLIGAPADLKFGPKEMDELKQILSRWEVGTIAILPWPLDVVDLRPVNAEKTPRRKRRGVSDGVDKNSDIR